MKQVIICCLTLVCIDAFTQSDSLLLMNISKLKKATNDSPMNNIRGSEKKVLQLLREREPVTASKEDIEIAYSCGLMMKKVKNQQLRKEMVERITNTCMTDSSSKCNRASNLLRSMQVKDFSNEAKQNIYKKALASGFKNSTTLLIGFLNIQKAYAQMKEEISSNNNVHWYTKLALARMGDESQIQDCLDEIAISEHPKFFKLQEMAYIKQPQLVNIYNYYLQSDKAIPDSYDVRGIDDASLGAKYLARLLIGFPLEFQTSPYTPAQIALARQWMLANKGKYKIRRDEF